MLIRAGKKKSRAALHALISTEYIRRRDRRIGMSNMRLAIDVINRGSDVYRIMGGQRALLAFAGTIRVAWRRQSVRRGA